MTDLLPVGFTQKAEYYVRISRVCRYMAACSFKEISLTGAARAACMEKTAFARYFRKTIGISFSEFLQRWRVQTVVDELTQPNTSLTEIAITCGFESIATFNRTFKRFTGQTPSRIRAQLLKEGKL
jgi:transcriptional regulator GlxA family with amidase domain